MGRQLVVAPQQLPRPPRHRHDRWVVAATAHVCGRGASGRMMLVWRPHNPRPCHQFAHLHDVGHHPHLDRPATPPSPRFLAHAAYLRRHRYRQLRCQFALSRLETHGCVTCPRRMTLVRLGRCRRLSSRTSRTAWATVSVPTGASHQVPRRMLHTRGYRVLQRGQ